MKVSVIGCGYWGKHLIRNFYQSNDWLLKYICDIDKQKLDKFKNMYSNVNAESDIDKMLNDDDLDAVAIATPVDTHFELAKKAILAGKHTWVEKPLTSNTRQAEELIELAEKHNVRLHVDHTFIYTSAVEKIKEIYLSGELGEFLYFDSVRINLGLFQHDINVLWDLAPHDFSILEHVIGKKPKSVNATGKSLMKYNQLNHEEISYITVNFDDDSLAHFHVNWLSPVKIRHIIIGGKNKMLVFNDMEPMAKIKVYDSGVQLYSEEEMENTLVQYRTGDMHSPAIKNVEALAKECSHFYNCIKDNKDTFTSGNSGLYVVKLLEASNKSLKSGGKEIQI